LRILYSVAISIPFIGPYLAFLIFGGEFPTATIVSRLFVFHVMLLPAILLGGVGVHLAILWRQKHTQFPGPGRTERNVVGKTFWPSQVFKSSGLMLLTAAVLALIGGLVQINPVWTYGPFIEQRFLTRDHRFHELLDRPRDNALRTSLGVAALLVFVVATIAGSNDVIAVILNVPVETMTNVLRILIFLVPIVGFLLTWRICHELQRDEARTIEPAKRVVLRRTPDGGFEEIEPVE
jgi:quinol-cytochrome oxidoreductase complex cytochrome b subunit